jgi:hypothetical protein
MMVSWDAKTRRRKTFPSPIPGTAKLLNITQAFEILSPGSITTHGKPLLLQHSGRTISSLDPHVLHFKMLHMPGICFIGTLAREPKF